MKKLVVATVALSLSIPAMAQTSVNTQAGASNTTEASASGSGASARSKTSVDTSADVHHEHKTKPQKPGDNAQANSSLAAGSNISAVLTRRVDSRRAKAGDPIYAKTTSDLKSEGNVLIPKGSTLVGHVTEAKARAKGDGESALAFTFDRAVLKGGHEVPLNTVVQAMAAAQNRATIDAADDSAMTASPMGSASGATRSGAGLLGGATSTLGATTSTVAGAGANLGGSAQGTLGAATRGASATTALTSASSGLIGMNGMQLTSQLANNSSASVITSAGKSVSLASGTEMMLRVVK